MKSSLPLLAVSLTLPFCASAATLDCTTSSGATYSLKIDSVQDVSMQKGRDRYHGGFTLADEPQGTRLTGYKSLDIKLGESDGCWPESTFEAHIVLSPPMFAEGSGWYEHFIDKGMDVRSGSISCKSDVALPALLLESN